MNNRLKMAITGLVIAIVALGINAYLEREKAKGALARLQILETQQKEVADAFDARIQAMNEALDELTNTLASKISDIIWAEHHSDIVAHPSLIASAAAKVYEEFGKDLRGKPGTSISAKEIASVLANEPGFADLVVQLQNQQNNP